MKLFVETIAAHQDLLLASLPDRLAPRWQLLSSIASERADFKAQDHLTALATLSDQDFAQVIRAFGELRHHTFTHVKSSWDTWITIVSLLFAVRQEMQLGWLI